MDKSMIGIENNLIMITEKVLALKIDYIKIGRSRFKDEIAILNDIIDFTTIIIQKIK